MDTNEILMRIADAIKSLQNFSWITLINLLSVFAAWVTIGFLLRERYEKNRPYLQISFRPIRSTLACVVLENVGRTPLNIRSLQFNNDFIKNLPQNTQNRLDGSKCTNIAIYPNRFWVLSLDVNYSEIINKFETKKLVVDFEYAKIDHTKIYSENTTIDFAEYAGMLEYISELDEFKQSVDKLSARFKKSSLYHD